MKKFAVVCLVLILTATSVFAQGKITIRLGHIRDTNHPTHLAALKFKELVESGSGGRIEVKVYPNSQLGDPKQMFALMQIGDLEMMYGGINTFAWVKGGEAYEITSMPFLFKDYDHMRKSLQSDFFKPIQEKAEKETGIKIININGDTAPRGLSTRDRPVVKAEDFKRPQDTDSREPDGVARNAGTRRAAATDCPVRAVHGPEDRRCRCTGEWCYCGSVFQPV
jgi:TRAP-type C4-dicarboxylate transport system, periplasmic component